MLKNHSQYDLSIWILSVFFTLSAIFALLVITPRFGKPKTGLRPAEQPVILWQLRHDGTAGIC